MLLSSVVALIFSSAVTSGKLSNFVRGLSLPSYAMAVFAQNQQCTRTYTVQAGDICDGISAAQHVSTCVHNLIIRASLNPSVAINLQF
jgi:hypothetical protein